MKPNRWKEKEYNGGWFSHPCPWWFSANGYHGKCENMDEKQICWKPDYEVLWKAFRLAVMGVLTFTKFIYSDDEVVMIMERYLEKAKEGDVRFGKNWLL